MFDVLFLVVPCDATLMAITESGPPNSISDCMTSTVTYKKVQESLAASMTL